MKELTIMIGDPGQTVVTIVPPHDLGTVQGFASNFFLFSTRHSLVSQIVTLLLVAAVLLGFVFTLIGGLKWITSQGDKKAMEGARNTIMYAIGGMLFALVAYIILTFLGSLLNIPLLQGSP